MAETGCTNTYGGRFGFCLALSVIDHVKSSLRAVLPFDERSPNEKSCRVSGAYHASIFADFEPRVLLRERTDGMDLGLTAVRLGLAKTNRSQAQQEGRIPSWNVIRLWHIYILQLRLPRRARR